jgi:hypothetical protein
MSNCLACGAARREPRPTNAGGLSGPPRRIAEGTCRCETVLLNQDTELEDQGGRSGYGRTDFFSGKTFERSRRISLFFYNVHLQLKGIRDENLPSITIVIPVTSGSGNLSETIQSLLASRYRRLQVVVVGVAKDQQVAESLPDHSSIKFSEAGPVATAPQAIRSILLRSVDPVFAWLRPGDRLSADTLNRVGRIFRRSRRIGGVIVRNESSEQSLDSRTEYNFDFLQTQDSTFSAKLFVRRECFWAATKVFAGTDFDCDDWAVAFNSARFFRIESLPGGYFGSTGDDDGDEPERTQNIRSKIDASVWRTERLRRAVDKRLKRLFRGLSWLGQRLVLQSRLTRLTTFANQPGQGVDLYVPPTWVENLVGFSPGETIAFLGSYRAAPASQPPMARYIFWDRTTDILILQEPAECTEGHQGSDTVEINVNSETQRRFQALTSGSAKLLQEIPGLARTYNTPELRVSSFPISSDRREASPEIPISRAVFDFLVLSQSLNSFSRPLIVLREAVNTLLWDASLVIGCAVFDRGRPKTDWQKSAWLMQPNFRILYSRNALFRLLQVAGLNIIRSIALTDEEIADLATEVTPAKEAMTRIGQRLFRIRANQRATGNYLLLVCQRTY